MLAFIAKLSKRLRRPQYYVTIAWHANRTSALVGYDMQVTYNSLNELTTEKKKNSFAFRQLYLYLFCIEKVLLFIYEEWMKNVNQ